MGLQGAVWRTHNPYGSKQVSDTPSPAPTDAPDPVGDPVDYKALYEKAQADLDRTEQARKRDEEKVRKANAAQRELDELKRSSMSETERLVAEARVEARAEVMSEFGSSLVDAEVRVALHGRLTPEQSAALIESVDRARFLTEDGKPDSKAIAAWADRVAPAAPPPKPATDLGQGARTPAAAAVMPGKDRLLAAYAETTTNKQ